METVNDVLARGSALQAMMTSTQYDSSKGCLVSQRSNTPRANEDCPTCKGAGFLVRDLHPTDPDFSQPVPCPTCHDGNLARRLRDMSQLDGTLTGVRLNNFRVVEGTQPAWQHVRDFVHDPRGFLTLWGGYGCGKTRLLATLVNECTEARIGAVYYTLPDLLAVLRESVGENVYNRQHTRILSVRVLAIDEVDKARLTDWAKEQIYTLVDSRYRLRHTQGTVFAMNVQPDHHDPELGYLYSRMGEGTVVHVTAGDMRARIGRAA